MSGGYLAAQGNETIDRSKQIVDSSSPDDGTLITGDVTDARVAIPLGSPPA